MRKWLLKKLVEVRLWNGALYLANSTGGMASYGFYTRIHHSALIKFMNKVADDGPMVYVGAKTGLFSLLLSHQFK